MQTLLCRRACKYEAAADDRCLTSIALPPSRNGGVYDENHQQIEAQLTDEHPWVRRALRNRNRFAEKWDVPKVCDVR